MSRVVKVTLTITHDRDVDDPLIEQAIRGTVAEGYVEQLRNELLAGHEDDGPWGWGPWRRLAKVVVVEGRAEVVR